jgi:alpha-D-ribose 1-methylphosphonate 5-triphosphate synthase subunit PhnH
MNAALLPGFTDPALDAQRCFRAVLEAMSRPGRVQQLEGVALEAPAPLGRAAAAVLLTLADADTPVWLDAAALPSAPWLRFHAGCPVVTEPARAAFALACGTPPPLTAFPAGTEEEPQEGATLILQLAALAEGTGPWHLAGPGIEALHRLDAEGLPADFALQWAANHAAFPRGVDLVLCAGDALVALPRSTRLERR